ncbi:hypothetical protein DSM107133_04109 (plasmid) [Pseudosulfitobacter sp. DSM 107133]|nr:hypothetical protein DSM107133_04109 [Pseudosulfitobacter sp. DSM 107133]
MINFKSAFRGCALVSAMAAVPVAAQAQDFINVLTGGTSGVYYPLGAGLANIYGEKIDGARTQVQSTKASVENLNLLQSGRGKLGFALGDSVAMAWAGNADAGFPAKVDKLRGYCQVVGISLRNLANAGSCHHFRGVICPEAESIGAGVAV